MNDIIDLDLLSVTRAEAWAIHIFLHHKTEHDDRPFAQTVFKAITVLEDDKARANFPLQVIQEDLWAITKLVSPDFMMGNEFAGRSLLLKAMRLLIKVEGGGNDDDRDSANADADHRTGDATAA